MLRLLRGCAAWLALSLTAGTCLAQHPEAKFYKLDFVLKEVEGGKVLNSRSYSTTVSTDKNQPGSSIRAGSKVPYTTGGNSFNYADLGVNIDCKTASVVDANDELSLFVTAEMSSIAQGSATQSQPTIRQNRWSSNAVVPLNKPTVIFSSDDLTAKSQLQVQLTATPLR